MQKLKHLKVLSSSCSRLGPVHGFFPSPRNFARKMQPNLPRKRSRKVILKTFEFRENFVIQRRKDCEIHIVNYQGNYESN